jgi:hypothetical protein
MPVRLTTSLRPPEQITRAHVLVAEGPFWSSDLLHKAGMARCFALRASNCDGDLHAATQCCLLLQLLAPVLKIAFFNIV